MAGRVGQRRRAAAPFGDDDDPVVGGAEDLAPHVQRVDLDRGYPDLADPVQQVGEALRVRPRLPHPHDHSARPYTVTRVSGIAESAGRSSRLAATPEATR